MTLRISKNSFMIVSQQHASNFTRRNVIILYTLTLNHPPLPFDDSCAKCFGDDFHQTAATGISAIDTPNESIPGSRVLSGICKCV